MPYSLIMLFAISVALERSLWAPVDMSPKTIPSAALPPRSEAILLRSSVSLHQETILGRDLHGITQGGNAAGNDGDFLNRVRARQRQGPQGHGPSRDRQRLSSPPDLSDGSSFSSPATILSTASSNSGIPTSFLPLLTASSAASLTRLARSAPTIPGVMPASFSTSRPAAERSYL